MSIEAEVKQIIENSHEDIVATVKEQLKQNIIDSLTYNFRADVSQIVSDYLKDSMADDIKKMLDDEKENMLNEIQKSCITIAAEVGKAMVETASKNLSSSYNSSDIIKKIFN